MHPMNIFIQGNLTISTYYDNYFPKRSNLYITNETILSESCKDFFGKQSVFVHKSDESTFISNEMTINVIDYISIPSEYPKTVENIYHHSKYFHLVSIFTSLKR